MPTTGRWGVALPALCLASCAPDLRAEGTTTRGIVGGAVDPLDPEAFMISFRVYGVPNMCSATLIAPRTLITAAHCVDPSLYPGSPRIEFQATNAPDARAAGSGDFIDVVDIRLHPGWSFRTSSRDLALLLLATPPAGVSPKPWNEDDVSGLSGSAVRTVGYGLTDPDDSWSYGVRHAVDLEIRAVDANYLTIGDTISRGFCSGDSGGPTFAAFPDGTERLIGVHSIGETCTDGRDVRVDAYADFIREWLQEKEGTPPESPGQDAGGPAPTIDAGAARDDAALPARLDAGVEVAMDASGGDAAASSVDALPELTLAPLPSPEASGPPPVRVLKDISSCAAVDPRDPGQALFLIVVGAGWLAARSVRTSRGSRRWGGRTGTRYPARAPRPRAWRC